jgi:hypothetical protein
MPFQGQGCPYQLDQWAVPDAFPFHLPDAVPFRLQLSKQPCMGFFYQPHAHQLQLM